MTELTLEALRSELATALEPIRSELASIRATATGGNKADNFANSTRPGIGNGLFLGSFLSD